MQVTPYLSFEGRCEEAIEFYKKAVGARVDTLMRFKEAPAGSCAGGSSIPPERENKVMHSALHIGDSLVMATDGQCTGKTSFVGTSLSLTVKTDADAEKYFAALGEGGNVFMPMAKTFFSSRFGMVADRFGVPWMVLVMPQ